jgi:hypothetical protein
MGEKTGRDANLTSVSPYRSVAELRICFRHTNMTTKNQSPALKLHTNAEPRKRSASSQSGTRAACRVWELDDYVGDWKMAGSATVSWSYKDLGRVVTRQVAANQDITRIEASTDSDALIPSYGDCAPLPMTLDRLNGNIELGSTVECEGSDGTPFQVSSTKVEMLSNDTARFTMVVVLHSAKAGAVHVTTDVEIKRESGLEELLEMK